MSIHNEFRFRTPSSAAVCPKCHYRLSPENLFCPQCGTKREKGTFDFSENIPVCIYNPPPVEREYNCPYCGHVWKKMVMISEEDYFCPKCGAELQTKDKVENAKHTITQGKKEHFYDVRINSTYPICAAESLAASQKGFKPSSEDFTFKPTENIPECLYLPPLPPPQPEHRLIVGWLVCTNGPDKGKDYKIYIGNNYIGRTQRMDICIQSDNHISSVNAAVLAFDDVDGVFFFGPAGGRNTLRINGKPVINAVELNSYDRITIGVTELMLVPLCGEKSSWNAQKNTENEK